MARINLLVALVVFVAVSAAVGEAVMTCGSVQGLLAPCLKYLTTAGAVADKACCGGVTDLMKAASTAPDRRTACNCLKTSATKIPGIIPGNAMKLPSACKVKIPYQISPNTNCNNIK